MVDFTIKQVTTSKHIVDFHKLPFILHGAISGWIPPIMNEIESVFAPTKNATAFGNGEIVRWNVYDQRHTIVGRIAAFTNSKYKNKGDTQPTGGIGFFESIQNQEVAFMLLDTAKHWLQSKGMEAMDGPINFGERDKWWGLLTEGFEFPVLYGMTYSPSYYKDFFTQYGFEVFYDQYVFSIPVNVKLSDRHWQYYNKWAEMPGITVEYVNRFKLKKYATDFAKIYNLAWATHESEKNMTEHEALRLFRKMRFVMDPKIAFFVYHNGQPIGFWINLPELNYYMKHLKGKWNLWAKVKLIFLLLFSRPKSFVGVIFGIVPEWQGKGIDKYLPIRAILMSAHLRRHYQRSFLRWIGDFNPKMLAMVARLGATKYQTFCTMRYLFDRNKKFERHPMVNL